MNVIAFINSKGGLRVKHWLNILIVVCVLPTACSVKAKDRPTLPKSQKDADWEIFKQKNEKYIKQIEEQNKELQRNIKVFDKSDTQVTLDGDAEKIGLDEKELTDYLKLRIRNNFDDIKIVDMKEFFTKYTGKQQGGISLRIWVLGDDYPVAYHLKYTFFNYEYRYKESRPKGVRVNHSIWENEILKIGSKENVSDSIKKSIDDVIPKLAILFYEVRGEL
jgi:hypothetical protein